MAVEYAYTYALINLTTGECFQVDDSTNYIINRKYVPIPEYNENYLLKYYYPLPPESVSSFSDFTGEWYVDAAHTTKWNP